MEQLESDINDILIHWVSGELTDDTEKLLICLEQERNNLLREKEEIWRQHNRAIWIKGGDQNTKFFHQYAIYRRNRKQIWEVEDSSRRQHTCQENIKTKTVRYFNNFFKAQGQCLSMEQCRIVRLFTHMVSDLDTNSLAHPVNIEELKEVLHSFKKYKSPSLDGWTMEFFTIFFDLVGNDLLDIVEESRTKGWVINSIKSTFIAMISKTNKPTTYPYLFAILFTK
jgi:hypothetical protein